MKVLKTIVYLVGSCILLTAPVAALASLPCSPDTIPPVVQCPANITVTSCTSQSVTYTAVATDACGLSSFACTPPSGSSFPVGVTPVTCTAVDNSGNSASCTFQVTVTCPPVDSDADGVLDTADRCADTPPNSIVNADGCAVGQICKCDADWKNHGDFVKCVTQATNEFMRAGIIDGQQKGAIVSEAAGLACGK